MVVKICLRYAYDELRILPVFQCQLCKYVQIASQSLKTYTYLLHNMIRFFQTNTRFPVIDSRFYRCVFVLKGVRTSGSITLI